MNHTDQTELSSSLAPDHVVQKLPSCSEGGCLPSLRRPVGLHSCCCHRLAKHGLKAELQASSHLVSIETPGHVTQTARLSRCGDTPSFVSPSVQVHSSSPSPALLPMFTAHYSVQHFGRTLRGGRCRAFYTVCNKFRVVTRNQRVWLFLACRDQNMCEEVWCCCDFSALPSLKQSSDVWGIFAAVPTHHIPDTVFCVSCAFFKFMFEKLKSHPPLIIIINIFSTIS